MELNGVIMGQWGSLGSVGLVEGRWGSVCNVYTPMGNGQTYFKNLVV